MNWQQLVVRWLSLRMAILFLGVTGVILYALPIVKKRVNCKKRMLPA